MQPGLLVIVLPRQSQVDLCRAAGLDAGGAKGLCDCFPGLDSTLVCRHDGGAQVVGVEIVEVGGAEGCTGSQVSLPNGVGVPQPLLLGCGVPPIGLGDLARLVGFGHQGVVTMEVVAGGGAGPLADGLADSSAEWVVLVLRRGDAAGVGLLDLAQALCCVVAVVVGLAAGLFLGRVALRGVADGIDLAIVPLPSHASHAA